MNTPLTSPPCPSRPLATIYIYIDIYIYQMIQSEVKKNILCLILAPQAVGTPSFCVVCGPSPVTASETRVTCSAIAKSHVTSAQSRNRHSDSNSPLDWAVLLSTCTAFKEE